MTKKEKDSIFEAMELLTANISLMNRTIALVSQTVVLHEKYIRDLHVALGDTAQAMLAIVQEFKKAQSDIKEMQQKPFGQFISNN